MLRDIVCDAASNYALAPFLRLLTPKGFNQLLITVFNGKWREYVDATLLQIEMSNELCGNLMREKLVRFDNVNKWKNSSNRDDALNYVIHSLSRFHAETILYHAPNGSFLFRTPQPYSPVIFLSFCRWEEGANHPQIRHETIHRLSKEGYECKRCFATEEKMSRSIMRF